MLWQTIARIAEVALLMSFGLILANIVWQMLNGRILVSGMLAHRNGRLRFHRLQMVGVTTLFAGGYVYEALAQGPSTSIPDISAPMLALLVGSHATYLGGKIIG